MVMEQMLESPNRPLLTYTVPQTASGIYTSAFGIEPKVFINISGADLSTPGPKYLGPRREKKFTLRRHFSRLATTLLHVDLRAKLSSYCNNRDRGV